MPTFPTYHGELPQRLNPLNPRHWLLLAYWVYFRPTALKCYLYQADPALYREGPGLGIFRTLRVPAHRSLYLTALGATFLIIILVGRPVALGTCWIQGAPVGWSGTALGVAFTVMLGVVVGVGFGVAIGVAEGVTFGVVFSVAAGVVLSMAFGVAGGVVGGMMGGVVSGVGHGVALGATSGMASGVVLGMAFSVVAGVTGIAGLGVVFGVGVGAGVLRLPFFLAQLVPAWRSRRAGRHPVEWDEYVVLPLPGTVQALTRHLQADRRVALQWLSAVAGNPFQRWAVQRALRTYVRGLSEPLHFLYALLNDPDLDVYVWAPVRERDWERVPAVRRVLLGELSGEWVDCNRTGERLIWRLTQFLRDRRATPLTRFAGILYQLLDTAAVEAEALDLSSYKEVCADLAVYPGGEEVVRSFDVMNRFLSYERLLALPGAVGVVAGWPEDEAPIRPAVLRALRHLGQVGAEVAAYRDATSRVNRLAALARATDALEDLDAELQVEVVPPERYLLRRVIRQWRRLVSEAGGELGRAEVEGPVANPYVAGNPVAGELFVGREDVLRRLEELWARPGQCPSVVLYGHRRMGKSSILHNLGARFGAQARVVDFNMQRVGLVSSTGELLHNLALALYDSLSPAARAALEGGEPEAVHFKDGSPYTAFDRFLKRLDRIREAGQRFIVTVDEFELIEAAIDERHLNPRLLDFWRGLIQTYPWFVMALAGLHTLHEMTRDYWHPLYGSVKALPVSFLAPAAARRLLTQPSLEFPLDYDADAVERVLALTHGQPYLVQLIGHALVTRFNRQTYEQGVARERRFSLTDVEAVINTPEFFRDGDAYFTGVWGQAKDSAPQGQLAVLRALARSPEGLDVDVIARRAGLTPERVTDALAALARHDVVQEADGRWRFTVALMRRWVAERAGNGDMAIPLEQ